MIVAIGTTNPVKIKAAKHTFNKAFRKVSFRTVEVPSGVNHTPLSTEETRRGAENRARRALKAVKDADFGVGIEGGVQETGDGLMLCGYVVVINRDGGLGVGGGTEIVLPPAYAKRIRAGMELGKINDEFAGEKNTKYKGGAIGLLTKRITTREQYFRMATAFALAPFISKWLYTA